MEKFIVKCDKNTNQQDFVLNFYRIEAITPDPYNGFGDWPYIAIGWDNPEGLTIFKSIHSSAASWKIMTYEEWLFFAKWSIKITKENLDEVGSYYDRGKDCTYNSNTNIGLSFSSHNLGSGDSVKLDYPKRGANFILPTREVGYPEITLEQFKIITKTNKMLKVGDKIEIKEGTSYGVIYSASRYELNNSWAYKYPDVRVFAKEEFEGKIYVHFERSGYTGRNYYITLESNITCPSKLMGFKTPIDMYKGLIKAGSVFIKRDEEFYQYSIKPNEIVSIPKEIVEAWEPVYITEQKRVTLGSPRREFTVKEDSISLVDGGGASRTYNLDILRGLKSKFGVFSFAGHDTYVKSVHIGCSEGVTLSEEDVDTLIKLNKEVCGQ